MEELFDAVDLAKDGERVISEMFKILPSRSVSTILYRPTTILSVPCLVICMDLFCDSVSPVV